MRLKMEKKFPRAASHTSGSRVNRPLRLWFVAIGLLTWSLGASQAVVIYGGPKLYAQQGSELVKYHTRVGYAVGAGFVFGHGTFHVHPRFEYERRTYGVEPITARASYISAEVDVEVWEIQLLGAWTLDSSTERSGSIIAGLYLINPMRTGVDLNKVTGVEHYPDIDNDARTGLGLSFGGRWSTNKERAGLFLEVFGNFKLITESGAGADDPRNEWNLGMNRFSFGVTLGAVLPW